MRTLDEWFYQTIQDWLSKRHVTLIANRLVITMKNSSHIINFVREKQPIEPMRSLVTCLQGKFWVFKK